MATKSSIHIKPCNIASSEAHNRRTAEYMRNIGESRIYVVSKLSTNNEQWVNPDFGTTELRTHYDNIKRMVKEKTGRAMQEKERELKEMLRMEKFCYAIGFTKDMVNNLLTKKEAIRCNGKIYSEEHRRKFDIKNDIFKIEKSSVDNNKLVLTINRQPIGEWFKEQWEKLRQGLRQSAEEPRKSRGFKL